MERYKSNPGRWFLIPRKVMPAQLPRIALPVALLLKGVCRENRDWAVPVALKAVPAGPDPRWGTSRDSQQEDAATRASRPHRACAVPPSSACLCVSSLALYGRYASLSLFAVSLMLKVRH